MKVFDNISFYFDSYLGFKVYFLSSLTRRSFTRRSYSLLKSSSLKFPQVAVHSELRLRCLASCSTFKTLPLEMAYYFQHSQLQPAIVANRL
jgi:hypothetical protein